MTDELLSEIPGEMVGAAAHSLPGARTSEEQTLRVTVRLPDGQRAQVTLTRLRSKEGKSVQ
jgi:hypothetical protein